MKPRFSIIITSHNQSAFIREAVDSALAQTNQNREIIVVDDASKDDSPAVLKQYGDKILLAALQINQGTATARNLGATMASGEYCVFLDGDDTMLPWALDVYDRIVELKKPKIILSRMAWFDGPLPAVRPEEIPHEITFAEYEFLIKRNRPYQHGASAMVILRQAFHDVKGWTEGAFALDDVDLLMKLGYAGLSIQILSPYTIRYRIHGANVRHKIAWMIAGLFAVMDREKSGLYPGGPRHRFDRYAIIGAPVRFWIVSAFKAGQYRAAAKVLARGWLMFLAAFARKAGTVLRGYGQQQTVPLNSAPGRAAALQQKRVVT
jgi:glycosyltransferase involved in cell wall biosynthesis